MIDTIVELLLQVIIEKSDRRYTPLLEDILSATTPIAMYFVAAFGAATLQLFSLTKGRESTQPFLRKYFPMKSNAFYNWTDLVIVVFLGAFIGMLYFGPETAQQAFGAGLGWVGVLTTMTTQTHKSIEQAQPPEELGHD